VLENLCAEEHAISHKCNVAKSTLIDHLVQRYKEAFQDFFQEVCSDALLPIKKLFIFSFARAMILMKMTPML
jgi:hypothetical protein